MAPYYWDYPTSGTGYWDNYTGTATNTSTSGGGTYRRYHDTGTITSSTSTNSTNGWVYYSVVVRKDYLIEHPAHWSDADAADFVALVNDKTRTGFTITMLIKGDIAITDPNVERRSMADFVPLLLRHASAEDQKVIRDFFAAHPTTQPAA